MKTSKNWALRDSIFMCVNPPDGDTSGSTSTYIVGVKGGVCCMLDLPKPLEVIRSSAGLFESLMVPRPWFGDLAQLCAMYAPDDTEGLKKVLFNEGERLFNRCLRKLPLHTARTHGLTLVDPATGKDLLYDMQFGSLGKALASLSPKPSRVLSRRLQEVEARWAAREKALAARKAYEEARDKARLQIIEAREAAKRATAETRIALLEAQERVRSLVKRKQFVDRRSAMQAAHDRAFAKLLASADSLPFGFDGKFIRTRFGLVLSKKEMEILKERCF